MKLVDNIINNTQDVQQETADAGCSFMNELPGEGVNQSINQPNESTG